jgi:molybdenum cofactor synthesis domain-containing protein
MIGRLGQVSTQLPSLSSLSITSRKISTAACLVIGDEVLGGKIREGNGHFFSKYCTRNGIALRRIEVIPDEEVEIVEAVKRMSTKYDFVVTSGGIGPTHDDITYASIAKAFDLPLTLEEECFKRYRESRTDIDWATPSPQNEARKKMVTLPLDLTRKIVDEQIFFTEGSWTPMCVVNGNVHILPGVHSLFIRMLEAYEPVLVTKLAVPGGQVYRIVIETPMPESEVAPYLEKLAEKVKDKGVKVGSYPHNDKKNNTVDLVGKDKEYMESLVPEIEENVKGKLKATKLENAENAPEAK